MDGQRDNVTSSPGDDTGGTTDTCGLSTHSHTHDSTQYYTADGQTDRQTDTMLHRHLAATTPAESPTPADYLHIHTHTQTQIYRRTDGQTAWIREELAAIQQPNYLTN